MLCVIGVICACTEPVAFEPAGPEDAPDPSLMGPFAVGVQTRVELDFSRKGLDGIEPRRLVTEIWYPAAESSRAGVKVSYNIEDVLPPSLVEKLSHLTLDSFVTEAVRDAEPRASHGPYPVILFSHGSMSIRFQSTFLTTYLASHGYVVISPDHEGNTFAQLEEGNVLSLDAQLESLLNRPQDLLFVLDRYSELPEDDSLFEMLDVERVGVSGHSFGAVTTLRVAGMDSRIDAIAPQCPAGYSFTWLDIEKPLEEIGIPVMLQMAEDDRTTPAAMAESIWEHVRAPGYYLSLQTAGHFTYSDLCRLGTDVIKEVEAAGIGGGILGDGCGEENLIPDIALPIIRNYTIGFFNTYLRESEGSKTYLKPESGDAWATNEVGLSLK